MKKETDNRPAEVYLVWIELQHLGLTFGTEDIIFKMSKIKNSEALLWLISK
jgi:hypothetical protein